MKRALPYILVATGTVLFLFGLQIGTGEVPIMKKNEMPLNVITKEGELTQEMKDYIHKWIKENSSRINEPIFKRIYGSKN